MRWTHLELLEYLGYYTAVPLKMYGKNWLLL